MEKELDEVKPEDGELQELLSMPPDNATSIKPLSHGMKIHDKTEEERDPIAEVIGNYGKWQLKMTFLLSLCSFPCTFHIFSPTYIGAPTDFWCARPANLASLDPNVWANFSQPENTCSMIDVDYSNFTTEDIMQGLDPPIGNLAPCTHWEWDTSVIGKTIISEWQLVCDRGYLNTIAEVLFLCGIAIGGVVSGMISDHLGRKKTLMAALIMQTILGICITFCPWYELYLILRITLGFFSVSVVFSAFVLVVELVGGNWRATAGVCNFFPLPVSYIIVSCASLALPDWRHLQIALSIPGGFLISLWWIVPESPHWLLNMKRIPEVKEILREAVAFNGRKMPESLDKILQPSGVSTVEEHSLTLLDLLRGPIRKITLCAFVIWFATTVVYYGLVLNISNFGGDLHTTSILSGVVEIPAIALSIPVLLKMGRKFPICLSLAFAGLGCIAIAIADSTTDKQWVKSTLVMISKFSIGATNGMLPTFTAELYPTLMRNMGVGTSQVSAGVALVIIPYLWTLVDVALSLPLIIMGGLGIAGGFCVLLLPETANKSLTSMNYNEEKTAEIDNPANRNGPL